MSSWIALGLRTGIKTSRFPRGADEEANSAPSALALDLRHISPHDALAGARTCPTTALRAEGDERNGTLSFDLGQCIMCGRCARIAPESFKLQRDPRVAVRSRDGLKASLSWTEGRVEPGAAPRTAVPTELGGAVQELHKRSSRIFRRSLHIRHVDAGSCNAAESELQMLSSPYYDLNRLGLFFTPTPRHADALLVTGVVTTQMEQPLLDTYEAMPSPKLVVAAGVCAIGGGVFADGFMTRGPLDHLLPVDVYVPGSPPTPLALLHGLLLAAGKAEERLRLIEGADGS